MLRRLLDVVLRLAGIARVEDVERGEDAVAVLNDRVEEVSKKADRSETEIERQKKRLQEIEQSVRVMKAQTGVHSVPRRQGAMRQSGDHKCH